MHFGSISLLQDPAAARISDLITANAGRRVIVLDPNILLAYEVGDLAAYRVRLHDWLRSDLLKLSDEDVEALKPGCAHAAAADQWLAAGPRAVVITSGGEGAVLYRREQAPLPVAAPRIKLADTIGAGDTFTAGLSVALLEHGVHGNAALERLDNADWLEECCASRQRRRRSTARAKALIRRRWPKCRTPSPRGSPSHGVG